MLEGPDCVVGEGLGCHFAARTVESCVDVEVAGLDCGIVIVVGCEGAVVVGLNQIATVAGRELVENIGCDGALGVDWDYDIVSVSCEGAAVAGLHHQVMNYGVLVNPPLVGCQWSAHLDRSLHVVENLNTTNSGIRLVIEKVCWLLSRTRYRQCEARAKHRIGHCERSNKALAHA